LIFHEIFLGLFKANTNRTIIIIPCLYGKTKSFCKNILSSNVKKIYFLVDLIYYYIDYHKIMEFGTGLDKSFKKEIMERRVSFSEVNQTGMVESIPSLNYLLDACKRNDLKAQLYLYKLYYKKMFSLSLDIVKDLVLAENIMQESFLVALEKIGSCSEIISFDSRLKETVETLSRNRFNKI